MTNAKYMHFIILLCDDKKAYANLNLGETA